MDQVRVRSVKLDVCKSMGSDMMAPIRAKGVSR